FRLHDEGAHGDDAHARTDAVAVRRVPAPPGHRDAAPAHAAPQRVGARDRAASRPASRGGMGELSAAPRQSSRSARASLPAARRGRHPDLRGERRRGGRREVHRGGRVPVSPRQRRRCEDADHPSRVDHAPAIERRRAACRRRVARDDPPVRGARDARRHPVRPRPGAGEVTTMTTRYVPLPWPWLGLLLAIALVGQEALLHWFGTAPAINEAAYRVGVMSLGVACLALILLPPRRVAYMLGFLVCAALIGWALWLQYGEGLEPCPLCMFQRVAVIAAGIVFLAAAIHDPRRAGAAVYAVLTILL